MSRMYLAVGLGALLALAISACCVGPSPRAPMEPVDAVLDSLNISCLDIRECASFDQEYLASLPIRLDPVEQIFTDFEVVGTRWFRAALGGGILSAYECRFREHKQSSEFGQGEDLFNVDLLVYLDLTPELRTGTAPGGHVLPSEESIVDGEWREDYHTGLFSVRIVKLERVSGDREVPVIRTESQWMTAEASLRESAAECDRRRVPLMDQAPWARIKSLGLHRIQWLDYWNGWVGIGERDGQSTYSTLTLLGELTEYPGIESVISDYALAMAPKLRDLEFFRGVCVDSFWPLPGNRLLIGVDTSDLVGEEYHEVRSALYAGTTSQVSHRRRNIPKIWTEEAGLLFLVDCSDSANMHIESVDSVPGYPHIESSHLAMLDSDEWVLSTRYQVLYYVRIKEKLIEVELLQQLIGWTDRYDSQRLSIETGRAIESRRLTDMPFIITEAPGVSGHSCLGHIEGVHFYSGIRPSIVSIGPAEYPSRSYTLQEVAGYRRPVPFDPGTDFQVNEHVLPRKCGEVCFLLPVVVCDLPAVVALTYNWSLWPNADVNTSFRYEAYLVVPSLDLVVPVPLSQAAQRFSYRMRTTSTHFTPNRSAFRYTRDGFVERQTVEGHNSASMYFGAGHSTLVLTLLPRRK